ncbi:hypothetical protein HBH56_131940 [Parastagonospora nodorum]|uniref:Rhodopsin domain-containing protein n=2 Tax=Phaeosphaeria nodorum (strain SN15 / ATCC MYA-4574 / FGSC 10173) TaxID=321614 RepID=A0A7U2I5T4_PHANO|nr:hypothetical protein SNOG_11578 [Parastagonospora nodorum SN15]KAH3911219.1 hypothetical protein HBH56_131940 [Parastagonospora nodorum]EAT81286.1 hypothetical protein SNOG_11578 [Parastagonospora nodorum SN15]KAH3926868.1 hypothetical protein HBH54_161280 [Parastagonospora nodorum]KAH3949366.1 hypothetical protein HBH53_086890 [Parastagonospora nodorum]KAH4066953.1 hypothetical protein HBH50_145230 [Parastagonospora nodorum]
MADVTPNSPYSNKAGTYLIPVCTVAAIALVLVVIRVYTRLSRTGRLHLDDWLIVVAEPLSLVGLSLAIAAVIHGWGKPISYFSPENLKETLRLQFALQTVWIVTYCLVRLSVACSLLRYGFDRSWRWPLYFIIGLQVTISSSYIVIQFAQCTPISSNWERIPGAKCWNIQPIINYGWAIASIYIATDLALSLMPVRLIRTLNRSTSEKILIFALMALGLLATGIACAKMTTFTTFGKGDPMQGTILPSLWAKLEEQVGIIASSLPCLKNPIERLLKSTGILKEHQLKRPSFVADLSLPAVPKDSDEQDSSVGSLINEDIRVDSAAVASTSNVNISAQGHRSKTLQAV